MIDTRITGITKVNQYFSKISVEIPKALRKDMEAIARDYEEAYKSQATARPFEGVLEQKIYAKKRNANEIGVYMPQYGVWLDRMPTHTVFAGPYNQTRGKMRSPTQPTLRRWYLRNRRANASPFFNVHAHPWIEKANNRARIKIKDRLANGNLKKVLRET